VCRRLGVNNPFGESLFFVDDLTSAKLGGLSVDRSADQRRQPS
jgi:hypothetical protein